MKCLVIGANGFIGRSVVAKLRAEGHEAICMGFAKGHKTDGNEEFEHIDIRNRSDVLSKLTRVDILFHMGGVLGTHELNSMCHEAVLSNIVGTVNLLDACVEKSIRRVVYPAKPNIWFNAYTITKRASLDLTMLYRRRYGLDVRAVILRNAYGPGQSTGPVRKIIPDMMTRVARGKPIEIFGSGHQPVDLVHISDLAEALVVAGLDDSVTDVEWPVDTGRIIRLSVNELATEIQQVTGRNVGVEHVPMRDGESEYEWLGPPTERTVFGSAGLSLSPYPLAQGLQESYSYYSHLAHRARV